jgi:hypothetical protein
LIVYCDVSLSEPMEKVAAAYERNHGGKVQVQYGASGVLVRQMGLTPKWDGFVTTSREFLNDARRQKISFEDEFPVTPSGPWEDRTWLGLRSVSERQPEITQFAQVILQNSAAFAKSDAPDDDDDAEPPWFRQAVGDKRSADVVELHLDILRIGVRDDDVKHLSRLPNLRELSLDAHLMTDAGLKHLSKLSQLRILSLRGPKLTDADLTSLAQLTNLEELYLVSCQAVTDRGLIHLTPLTKLKALGFRGCRRIGDGLSHLRQFESLESLDLEITGVSDAGMPHVGQLTKLTNLGLELTQVTDAGLQHLAGLRQLVTLRLPEGVTDAGIVHIAGFMHLKILDIDQTQITEAGVKKLRHQLPKGTIIDRD